MCHSRAGGNPGNEQKEENNFGEIKHNVPKNSEIIRSTFFVIVINELREK
jgi:hypothetical protein